MKTELIASWKLVNANGKEQYIVTTTSGQTIWIPKAQFDTNAEQITYKTMKVGDEYTKQDGTKGKLKQDRNEFLGAGKQVIKKYDAKELLEFMNSKGITPTFALS